MDETSAKDSVISQASVSMEAWLLSERILTASQAELARREGTRLGLSFSEIVQRLGLVTSEELSQFRSIRGQLKTATDFIQEGQLEGHKGIRRIRRTEEKLERIYIHVLT